MSRAQDEIIPNSPRVFDTPTLLFMLAALLFLYAFVFVPPFAPIDHSGDGLVILGDALRMRDGEVMYRDFFQFTAPGTALVYFLVFELFGPRLWVLSLALLLLGIGLAWLGIVIARKVMRRNLALLPSAIFLVGVYKNRLDATHHWYSLLTATAALAVLMERRTAARIVATGFLCGLTACFTQSSGLAVTVGFAAYLWWESRGRREDWRQLLKKEAWLLGGVLMALVGVNAYFVWKAGLARFLWCTIVFGLKYHPKQMDENSFWVLTNDLPRLAWQANVFFRLATWLFIFVVVPLIPILFFGRYWRESRNKPREYWERPMLLAMVGSLMVLSVVPAPASIRVASSTLPGIVLLGWFLDSPRKLGRSIAVLLTAGILFVIPHGVARFQSIERGILTTPHGQLAVADPEILEQYSWVLQHTHPSEYLYQAAAPYMYFYLDLRNPTPLPLLTNCGYTTPEQVAEATRGLERHRVRYVVWSPSILDTIPDWEKPSDNHLGPLRDYLHRYYRLVKVFPNSDEVWERTAEQELE
jgi:hypothetical protein